ncbi:MAG TPA: anti-sigma factor [Thermoanaerobaculia bacterium]|nr:anti-sigma factor [Thermoanaerobaculia bacterium]
MFCPRIDLHRHFPQYLDGAAAPRSVERIERHLLDCSGCRARLVRLREAKRLLGALPAADAPPFDRLMARTPARHPRRPWIMPRMVTHFAADALVAVALFAIFTLLYTHTASARTRPFDAASFRPVSVAQVAATEDPHVIVSGVVSQLDGDFREGSHRFRLVDPNDGRSFVVCEILDGDPLSPPKPGSLVRVWGVSRYDASPNHRWFEIHPVLKMEVVR